MLDLNAYEQLSRHCSEAGARLVAVSKTKPVEEIQALYDAGQRVFGENRVQELAEKAVLLPKDIEWHTIGHLQSNKVKYIAEFVSLIHSVDSFKLLYEIDKQAAKRDRTINCLLQLRIATEESKHGMDFDDILTTLNEDGLEKYPNIRVLGLMGMATFTDDRKQISREFKILRSRFDQLQKGYFKADETFGELSMGMSADYQLALEEGSTLIRVGSLIFGSRQAIN